MFMDDDWFTLSPSVRKTLYAILILTSLGSCLGRLMTAKSKDSRGPFMSANDRSRWCMIRSLVDSNSYAIDKLQTRKYRGNWFTIDKVQHQGRDGKLHFYSSKPPLVPTMIAGQYWLIKMGTGATFEDHPFPITRVMLVLTNLLPLILYFWLMVGLIERWCDTDWARVFAVATVCWGTYLTTFVITLNNHLPAAICTLVCLHVFISIWYDEKRQPWLFAVAGLAAAFAFANELPALSLLGLLGLALLYKAPKQTLLFGVPAVALVIGAYFGVNYVAHDTWRPPYTHRNADVVGNGALGNDDWYDYEGSHWRNPAITGVDAGEPSQAVYAFHSLVGHHGIFSLTPVWIFSLCGLTLLASSRREVPMPALAWGIAILSLVCITFYLMRGLPDRNYGGVTSGFRWVFWFTPLWTFAMLPALDRIGFSKLWRRVAYCLLAVSVISTCYPSANPWQHPWPYQILDYLGIVG